MKRLRTIFPLLLCLLVASAAWVTQRPDLAGTLTGDVTIAPAVRANSAVTGAWVDIGRAPAIAYVVHTGQVDSAFYVLVQDSTAGAAVATRDSFLIAATADTAYTDYNYRHSGRWLRALIRASAAADSIYSSVSIIGNPRAR